LGTDALEERLDVYFETARGKLRTFAGLREVLHALRQHRMGLAVASSGRPEKIRFNLQQAGLSEFFSIVTSATEVEHGKPAPDLFLFAADRLGLSPSRCSVVEDSVFGIMAARGAGMRALGFTSSHPASLLWQAGAHAVFGHYAELPSLLGVAPDPESPDFIGF
jgi:HAD superfamily hydrolase (TIGR01509 family)